LSAAAISFSTRRTASLIRSSGADHEGMGYARWRIDRAFVLVPAQGYVGAWLQSFRDFPPRQKPGSFNIGDAMEKLTRTPQSN
jgi:hypothetical protein